jgi:hypothetical protein
VGDRNLWEEENELGGGEVWGMLAKIEALVASGRDVTAPEPSDSRKPAKKHWDSWKHAALHGQSDDGWEFGQWDAKPVRTPNSKAKLGANELY